MFEDQTVELLPARTTMGGLNFNVFNLFRRGGNILVGSGNGNNNGNTGPQTGLINISILNGSFNGNFNGNGNWIWGSGNA